MPIIPERDPDFSYGKSAAETESDRINRMARRLAGGKREKTTWSSRAVQALKQYGYARLKKQK